MTSPGGFTAGDVLAAADMNALPGGVVDYATKSSDQGSITTGSVITGLQVSYAAVAGRRYRATATGALMSNVAGDDVVVHFWDGSSALKQHVMRLAAASTAYGFSAVYEFTGAGSTVTLDIRVARIAGSGTITFDTSTGTATHTLEDIGPA